MLLLTYNPDSLSTVLFCYHHCAMCLSALIPFTYSTSALMHSRQSQRLMSLRCGRRAQRELKRCGEALSTYRKWTSVEKEHLYSWRYFRSTSELRGCRVLLWHRHRREAADLHSHCLTAEFSRFFFLFYLFSLWICLVICFLWILKTETE